MIQLHLQTREHLNQLTMHRKGEVKLGEKVSVLNNLDELATHRGTYVVFGICEDIGVLANYGKPGTRKAWEVFLNAFVNIQYHETTTNQESDITLLGSIHVTPTKKISSKTSKPTLGAIVERIDKIVADLVQRIVMAGKIPIIIGGGHNNAFGNIKGSCKALQSPINIINIDAHTDLRTADYRHSGNGFTYALDNPDGPYLDKYAIFGVHNNYTPHYIFEYIKQRKDRIHYFLMDTMLSEEKQKKEFPEALAQISNSHFGIELDCDSIAHFSSSAQSPSGFTLEMVRSFMITLGGLENSVYLHICEASPTKNNANQVGKALTYLVTDFINSHREAHATS